MPVHPRTRTPSGTAHFCHPVKKCGNPHAQTHHKKMRMSLKPQDQGGADLHRQEQEFRRSAQQSAAAYPVLEKTLRAPTKRNVVDLLRNPQLLNPVLGENLEDLPKNDVDEELECQRSAPQAVLYNSVLRKNLEDLPVRHHLHDPELKC